MSERSSSPLHLRTLWLLLLLASLMMAPLACTEPPKEDCPSTQITGADLSLCCEALSTCCSAFSGEKRNECEGNVSSGANLTCQAMYQEARAGELCPAFVKKK
jgi:hypothetical protein